MSLTYTEIVAKIEQYHDRFKTSENTREKIFQEFVLEIEEIYKNLEIDERTDIIEECVEMFDFEFDTKDCEKRLFDTGSVYIDGMLWDFSSLYPSIIEVYNIDQSK